MSSPEDDPVFGPLIHSYSRAQALEDGLLIDVSQTAREARFRLPVALTAAVWQRYVEVPQGVVGQDEAGRLWDILWMAYLGARAHRDAPAFLYGLYVRNDNIRPRPVELRCQIGPGDDGEPVITILLPDED